MSPSLTVNRIASQQGAVLRELRTSSLREAPYAFGETLEDALRVEPQSFDDTAAEHAHSPRVATFLLYTEGHPCGLVHAYVEEAGSARAFVAALWVAPAVRHLRGGELLVNAASHWLAAQGASEVHAWIADENRTAMRFYERLGFGPTGDRRTMSSHEQEHELLYVRHVQRETGA
ncbi:MULTISPECIES: GNAT family N-acetyltransferase [unclassified Caballeronia]|jgi:GNAT superfamily N-acetyltransferase|uniref:GNAT family N-acetyltransferase n=1 Tax=unclassified Caballeronia TaxID=2646786 RepID=UPI001FD09D94|nr:MULTISPECIES: GNAT family N-acetyltransferase [unclassified Caballeronia]MDR5770848.1 GNAT family N-acetyltransferase [Caballeronia sp. LZ002]MDR5802759.1 GNAT family N-acetyltransferase [Caballeronia sp. LZ001]MDR5846285.1 GNAT family N-acetyltransferase [Caballeronia sp. LZ003]